MQAPIWFKKSAEKRWRVFQLFNGEDFHLCWFFCFPKQHVYRFLENHLRKKRRKAILQSTSVNFYWFERFQRVLTGQNNSNICPVVK